MRKELARPGELLTLGELSRRLPLVNGRRVSRPTLRRLAAAGRFRAVRFGGRLVVTARDADALVRELVGGGA